MSESPHPATAPDISLEGTSGARRLRPARGHRLLLIFYQEDSTPTCTTQVSSFKEDFALLKELGAEVAAISSGSLASHRAFIERLGGLPFPLLSDPEGAAAKAFENWDAENRRAFRAVFVIDDMGQVRHASRHYSPSNFDEYERIFNALGLNT